MKIPDWEQRYRSRERELEDYASAPVKLVAETAKMLTPGRALDLACGTGRNAVWLATQGWSVTAVDGAAAAIEALGRRAQQAGVAVQVKVADLEKQQFRIEPGAWDLICICYYLQPALFEPAKRGLAPGGVIIAIVHIDLPGERPGQHRLRRGELAGYFRDLEILHSYEGRPDDPAHQREVAEIVARKPAHSGP